MTSSPTVCRPLRLELRAWLDRFGPDTTVRATLPGFESPWSLGDSGRGTWRPDALLIGTDYAGLDRACPGDEPLEVAAIVNWFGITDVGDLLEGENRKNYAVTWLGSQTDRYEIAERVSPLSHVDGEDPPTLTVHGDADSVVPYSHATRLHEELEAAGVPNELVTIDGGGHGGFSRAEVERAYSAIDAFLETHLGSE